MIMLNNKEYEGAEGLTVQQLIDKEKLIYKRKIVKINGELIKEDKWASTIINSNDDVLIIHLMAGG